MELTPALLIILIMLLIVAIYKKSKIADASTAAENKDNFMSCVNTDCWNNITALDTVRLNPYYYPYSTTSCLSGQKNGGYKELPSKPIGITSLTAPDHVILTN